MEYSQISSQFILNWVRRRNHQAQALDDAQYQMNFNRKLPWTRNQESSFLLIQNWVGIRPVIFTTWETWTTFWKTLKKSNWTRFARCLQLQQPTYLIHRNSRMKQSKSNFWIKLHLKSNKSYKVSSLQTNLKDENQRNSTLNVKHAKTHQTPTLPFWHQYLNQT